VHAYIINVLLKFIYVLLKIMLGLVLLRLVCLFIYLFFVLLFILVISFCVFPLFLFFVFAVSFSFSICFFWFFFEEGGYFLSKYMLYNLSLQTFTRRLALREHWVHSRFLEGFVLLIFLILTVKCFCLRSVSSVAGVSGFSIPDCPFDFL